MSTSGTLARTEAVSWEFHPDFHVSGRILASGASTAGFRVCTSRELEVGDAVGRTYMLGCGVLLLNRNSTVQPDNPISIFFICAAITN